MNAEIKTLADELPKECARVRELQGLYRSIGPPGMFGVAMMEQSLRAADQAMVTGDVVGMLRAYRDLKEYEK